MEMEVRMPSTTSPTRYDAQSSGATHGCGGTVLSRRPKRYTAIAQEPSSVSANRKRVSALPPGAEIGRRYRAALQLDQKYSGSIPSSSSRGGSKRCGAGTRGTPATAANGAPPAPTAPPPEQ